MEKFARFGFYPSDFWNRKRLLSCQNNAEFDRLTNKKIGVTKMVNVKDTMLGTTTRKNFAKINEVMQMPNLIEVQKASYQWFLDEGLKEVFKDIGSITDYTKNQILVSLIFLLTMSQNILLLSVRLVT